MARMQLGMPWCGALTAVGHGRSPLTSRPRLVQLQAACLALARRFSSPPVPIEAGCSCHATNRRTDAISFYSQIIMASPGELQTPPWRAWMRLQSHSSPMDQFSSICAAFRGLALAEPSRSAAMTAQHSDQSPTMDISSHPSARPPSFPSVALPISPTPRPISAVVALPSAARATALPPGAESSLSSRRLRGVTRALSRVRSPGTLGRLVMRMVGSSLRHLTEVSTSRSSRWTLDTDLALLCVTYTALIFYGGCRIDDSIR